MKKSFIMTMALSLSVTAMAGDWTPYLKEMKDGCGGVNLPFDSNNEVILFNALPKAIKNDVAKVYDDEPYEDSGAALLKNATAFGYPLTRIQKFIDGDAESINLTFGANIEKLASQFHFKDSKGKIVKAGDTSKIYFVKAVQNQKTNKTTHTIVKEVPYPANLKNSEPLTISHYVAKKYGKKAEYNKLNLLFATKTGWEYFGDEGGYYLYIQKNVLSCGYWWGENWAYN